MSRRAWIIIGSVIAGAVIVLVVVLLATRGVTVPDVTGKTQADAVKAIEEVGLSVGTVTQLADQEAPAGSVIKQEPAAGAKADKGSKVALSVSTGPGTAAVPDVVGMTKAEAESALTSAGFVPASASQYDLSAPVGVVMEQLPAGGDQAAAGSQVGLLVSKGRPNVSVTVPDVTGMTADEATTTLADAGLVAVPVEAYVADVPKGDVAEQEPVAGVKATPLSEVLVTVSLGQGTTTVSVPDVVGQPKADAVKTLESAGLVVTVAQAYSPDVARGVVIAQEPKAGIKVEAGGDAGLLVSLGKPPSPTSSPSPSPTGQPSPSASPSQPPSGGIDPPTRPEIPRATVPDVVGMEAAQAEQELKSLGLRPVVLKAASATVPAGAVSAQLPKAGTQVPKTYPVLLLVSTGPVPQINPLPAGSTSPGGEASPTASGSTE